jgi:hypothetical protein
MIVLSSFLYLALAMAKLTIRRKGHTRKAFFGRSNDEQEQIVFSRAKEMGERKVVGELRALQVFFKRTDPQKSRRALELSKKVAGSFRGRQEVSYPEGLGKKQ